MKKSGPVCTMNDANQQHNWILQEVYANFQRKEDMG